MTRRSVRELAAASLIGCACLTATAHAAPTVRLAATLTPERPGHGTTVGFSFQLTDPGDGLPPPLTEIAVNYPGQLGIALSGLGLATCAPATLEALGPLGCPPNSQMGYGTAVAAIRVGPEISRETAAITLFRAPTAGGRLALLVYVSGLTPVYAQLVFPGLLLPAPAPFGGRIDVSVPLVPSLPGGPNVSVVELHSTLGPEHLTYYEHVHGRTIAYNPNGILLPDSCPRGGFPFLAMLGFEDGSHSEARATVPCPPRRRVRPQSRSR